jgi:hypothetical protein
MDVYENPHSSMLRHSDENTKLVQTYFSTKKPAFPQNFHARCAVCDADVSLMPRSSIESCNTFTMANNMAPTGSCFAVARLRTKRRQDSFLG